MRSRIYNEMSLPLFLRKLKGKWGSFSVKRNSAGITGQSSTSDAKRWAGSLPAASGTTTLPGGLEAAAKPLGHPAGGGNLSKDYLLLPPPDARARTPDPARGASLPRGWVRRRARPRPLPARARPRPFRLPLPGPALFRVGFSGPGWLRWQPPTAAGFKPEPRPRRAAPGSGWCPSL